MIKSYENYFVTSLLCYASDREAIKIDSCLTEMKKSLLINANNSLIEIETESIFKIDLELIKIAYIIVWFSMEPKDAFRWKVTIKIGS